MSIHRLVLSLVAVTAVMLGSGIPASAGDWDICANGSGQKAIVACSRYIRKNPANDVELLGRTLRSAGFSKVIIEKDLTREVSSYRAVTSNSEQCILGCLLDQQYCTGEALGVNPAECGTACQRGWLETCRVNTLACMARHRCY